MEAEAAPMKFDELAPAKIGLHKRTWWQESLSLERGLSVSPRMRSTLPDSREIVGVLLLTLYNTHVSMRRFQSPAYIRMVDFCR